MKHQLQRVVPHATECFHDALDELENEVRLAQTVLRRDMALLKQDRKKKEAAAKQHEVDKARLAAEARNPPPALDNAPVKPEKPATPTPPQPEPSTVHDASEPTTAMDIETDASKQEGASDNKANQNGRAPSPPKTSADANTEPPKDPLFDGTPPANNPNESDFDFDAMFGDAMDTSDQHNPDMMDTSADMDFNLDSANDGSSLLRGLEDFAKNGDDDNANQTSNMDMDFTMPDLPSLDTNTNTNTDSNATAATKSAPEAAPAPKADEPNPAAHPPPPPPPEEKKAEETTNNNNSSTNDNNDDLMGTMAADDLEDLFNMDEYANPEQSSFDDAFFNFE